ncbi:MAG: type VI secretion system protein, partial [Rhodospirillaceae bacterium]
MLSTLAPYLPAVAAGLGVLGVVVLGLLGLILAKVAKPPAPPAVAPIAVSPVAPLKAPEPPPAEPEAEPPPGLIARLLGHRRDGAAAARTVRQVIAAAVAESAGRRMNTTWLAMIGPSGSGKSAALEAVGAGRRLLDRPTGADARMDGECWSFEQGIVLDVPGVALDWSSTNELVGSASDQTWRAFLEAAGRARPSRPLDGVVLTIPADRLIGPHAMTREDLIAAGQFLHGRLRDMETWFGLRLPVYLLVSRCDAVPGFDGFWSQIPAERHSEMFGWSNPHSVDTAFTPAWMDAAFTELAIALRGVQVSLAAAADPSDRRAGDVVLFPGAFASLAAPVRMLAGLVFQSTAYREGFFLRGIYFSGALAGASGSRAPILVRQLLTRKALLEGGLVRPVSGRWTRRRRLVRRLQVGMAAATVVLALMLAWRLDDLRMGLPTLELPLREIAEVRAQPLADVSHNSPGTVHWGEKAAASRMLMALSDIMLDGLSSPLIPSSWFDSLEGDITAFARVGFDRLIMSVIEERLGDSIEYWLSGQGADAGGTTLEARAKLLVDELARLRVLNQAVMTYDHLRAKGDVADLRTLVADLFHITLPSGIDSLPAFLSRALEDGQGGAAARFSVAPYADRARARITTVADQVFDALTDGSALAEEARLLTVQITGLALGHQADADALAQVTKTVSQLKASLEHPLFAWVRTGKRSVGGQFDALLADMTGNAFLGAPLADVLSAKGQTRVDRFRRTLLAHQAPLLDAPLFAVTSADDPTLVLSPAATDLEARLAALFRQPFMAEADAAVMPDGVDMLWDAEGLSGAVTLYRAWGTYAAA